MTVYSELDFSQANGTLLESIDPAWVVNGSYKLHTQDGFLEQVNYASMYNYDYGGGAVEFDCIIESEGGVTVPVLRLMLGHDGTFSELPGVRFETKADGTGFTIREGWTTLATISDTWNTAGTRRKIKFTYNGSDSATLEVRDAADDSLIGSETASGLTSDGNYCTLNFSGTPSGPLLMKMDSLNLWDGQASQSLADMWVNVGGTAKRMQSMHVNVGGTPKLVNGLWVNIGGTAKSVNI